jgi:hypothetical protein
VWQVFSPDGKLVCKPDMATKPWSSVSYDADNIADLARMSKLRTWVSREAAKVPWTKLSDPDVDNRYCFGEITQVVPWLLEGMVSQEADLRAAAAGMIWTDTSHQGSIYESSARMTPFFLRMLTSSEGDPRSLCELLGAYADSLRGSLPHLDPKARDAETRWLKFMHESFVVARPELVKLAGRTTGEARTLVLGLLARGVFGDELWTDVWKLFTTAKGDVERAQLALACGPQAKSAAHLRELAAALPRETHAAVKFAIALSLVQASARLKQRPPSDSVELLVQYATEAPEELTSVYENLSGEDAAGPVRANIAASLANSLSSLPDRLPIAERLLPPLSKQMPRRDDDRSLSIRRRDPVSLAAS